MKHLEKAEKIMKFESQFINTAGDSASLDFNKLRLAGFSIFNMTSYDSVCEVLQVSSGTDSFICTICPHSFGNSIFVDIAEFA